MEHPNRIQIPYAPGKGPNSGKNTNKLQPAPKKLTKKTNDRDEGIQKITKRNGPGPNPDKESKNRRSPNKYNSVQHNSKYNGDYGTPNKRKRDGAGKQFETKISHSEPIRKRSRKMDFQADALMKRLKGGKFRMLNEQLYSVSGEESKKMFEEDPTLFDEYHEGFREQVDLWPINPVDIFIEELKRKNKPLIIGDFGCGEAKIAQTLCKTHKIHSFDLIAANDHVTACDIANVPLEDNVLNVAIFCLSLMGTNFCDFILEANRTLKTGGVMKIADVKSRFLDIDSFVSAVEKMGFKLENMEESHSIFVFFEFRKISRPPRKVQYQLEPWLYKKR